MTQSPMPDRWRAAIALAYEITDMLRTAFDAKPHEEMEWLIPVDFPQEHIGMMAYAADRPGQPEKIIGVPCRRIAGLDRPYLAHKLTKDPLPADRPTGDPTARSTALAEIASALESWFATLDESVAFPDGSSGAGRVLQRLLDLGYRAPLDDLGDEDIAVHVKLTGGPGTALIASRVDLPHDELPASEVQREFALGVRNQQVTLAEIKAAFR